MSGVAKIPTTEEKYRVIGHFYRIISGLSQDGNIDNLFLEENDAVLKDLLSDLRKCKIKFDDFAKQCGFNYSRLFSVDSFNTVVDMVLHYFRTTGGNETFRGIAARDKYLKQKIDTTLDQCGIKSLSDLLIRAGVDNDLFDNHQSIKNEELETQEFFIFYELENEFPNKVLPAGFSSNPKYNKFYDKLVTFAKRCAGGDFDKYLAMHGFSREQYRGPKSRIDDSTKRLVLREGDFEKYELTDCAKYDVQLFSVDEHIKTYQKYIQSNAKEKQ